VHILLVSQMYPGPADPDLGVFVADLETALAARGHTIERAVLDRRAGGKRRHLELARDAVAAARRCRPDVIYAHFLAPAGASAALASLVSGAPLVVTAHGQDVRNVGELPGARLVVRAVCARARAVIAVSGWLRAELEARVPEARGKTEVIDCGVDTRRFRPQPAPPLGPRPAFLCVGSLTERKNVLRLAEAFAALGGGGAGGAGGAGGGAGGPGDPGAPVGSLTFAGDGPLRAALEGRPGVRLLGRVAHDAIPGLLAGCDVLCQPSLEEPFGQATLEALAAGRPVVATRVGGPPEFVPPDAGILVDPTDTAALTGALRAAAALPRDNVTAREAALAHDVGRQAERIEAVLLRAAAGGSAR
jgi:glycosyltransferase involved in cell wall biosynthesis